MVTAGRLLGLFTVIPGSILLMLSFFVLFAAEKAGEAGLRNFGKAIAVLLCMAAGLVFGAGAFAILTGCHPILMILQRVLNG